MAGKRVAVLAPDGTFGTMPEEEVSNLPEGARVLSQKEVETRDAEIRQEERAEKAGVAGKIQTVLGAAGGVLNPLAFTGGAGSVGEAYNKGVTSGVTAGFDDVVARKAIDATAGQAQGAKYAQRVDDIKLTRPISHTAGEVAGFVAGAVAPVPATPAGLIGKAGALVEGGAGLALKGGGGALRQAATTGVKMGLRGGVEAGLTSAMQSAADDLVHDREINGEKLLTMMGHGAIGGAALGGGLGFTGSLAASGVKAGARSVIRGLSRTAEENPGGKLAQVLGDADGAARATANDQAWRSMGAGFDLQSTSFAKRAGKYLKNGTADLGEAAIRHGIIDIPQGMTPRQAAMHAARTGTPAEMLPRAEAAWDRAGREVGDIVEASGARIQAPEVIDLVERVASKYESTAATRPVGRQIRAYGTELADSLGIRSLDDAVPVQALIRERRAAGRIAFGDATTVDPKLGLEAKRALVSEMEDLVERAMDKASGQVPGAQRAQYMQAKGDYHKLGLIVEALEDSTARAAKARTLSVTDYGAAIASAASGHPLAAPVVAIGHHVIRTRGNAAAAAYLTRAAEQQTFSKLMQKAEALVGDSVKGLLAEAPTTPRKLPAAAKKTTRDVAAGKAEHDAVREEAKAIQKWHSGISENPRSTFSQLQDAAAIVGRHAGPRAAAAYTSSTLKAIAYVSRYVPVKERRDPLDPRSVPPLTLDEAQALTRAYRYANDPKEIWKDFGKGIVTPEGIEAAKEFQAEQFADFQMQLFDRVQQHLLHNKQLTQSHRLRIDKLLEGAAIRPDDVARNQQNFQPLPPEPEQGPSPGGNKAPDMPIQNAGFDAVEMRKAQ
jgi:hypothetical protein